MIMTMHGNLPASAPVKLATTGSRVSRRSGTEHQGGNVAARADVGAHRADRLAFLDDDHRLDPCRIDDLADVGSDACLDPQSLLSLDCRLNAAPLDEILRRDDCKHFDRSAVLTARRAAKRNAMRDSALSSTNTR
jgi:hypothetical protein